MVCTIKKWDFIAHKLYGGFIFMSYMKHFMMSMIVLSLLGLISFDAAARSFRPGMMPHGTVFNCATCHISQFGGGARNPFGNAVNARVNPGATTQFWGPELAALDSDGDGFSNGEELQDPNGLWRQGNPQPGDRSLVTNPGDPNSKPALVITPVELPFFEDFESLTLGDSVEEEVPAQDVWTNVPPNSWTIDNSGVVGADEGLGVDEWIGWTFANKDWWAATAGDQDRSQFANASGTVAIADPDEWDDLDDPESLGSFTSFLSTPPIIVSNAGSLALNFDSSWRQEEPQEVNITVSYDEGEPQEVLRWTWMENDPNFHADAPNEHVTVQLNIPDGTSVMQITFGMLEAKNDWWWAIDNIEVAEFTHVSEWALY
jgi:hypothetical protein